MALAPSPEQQVRFFQNLQYLLAEGEFVSSYKFALLLSLGRWAIENPDYDERNALDVGELAEHFVELYWPQARPFTVGERERAVAEGSPTYGTQLPSEWDTLLVQDRGRQLPRVLRLILAEHQAGHVRFRDVPPLRRQQLLAEVRRSIKEMPLWKLHTVGGEREFRFLYRRGDSDYQLRFEPGIVACLAKFALLLEDVVRSRWMRFVLGCNHRLLASAAQVEEFLFPDGRQGLAAWRPVLQEVQRADCFYCLRPMSADAVVDHFLPWVRYRRDLGHNFVLAHAQCNQQKNDHLASCAHLERWCQRNEDHGPQMAAGFDRVGLPHDWATLRKVAGSLYQIAENVDARVWQQGQKHLVPLDAAWRRILGVA
jgi:HNH endonuclease